MNSITIGNSKLTSAQVDRVLSGEKVNKVMTIWDKIKDFFHISDKKQVMTLFYDVYYNPKVSFLDKIDKFQELRNLSLNDYKDTFNIKIDDNVFYFEIGDIQDGTHISQSYFKIDCTEEQNENIINNQSIKSLFNQSPQNDIDNIVSIVVDKIDRINKMENKSTEEKIELIRSTLSLLLNDDNYRDKELDSFKKGKSKLNEIASKKNCSGMTEKYVMDKIWKIIKENGNEKYNDYYTSLLIDNIFNDRFYSTYNIIYSYLGLKEILNKDRKILDIEFTPEKVTFFLLDENNNKIISNEHSNITQKFNLDFAAFEYIINNENVYNNANLKEDKENLTNFLSTYYILSEKLDEKDKGDLFIKILNLKEEKNILGDKLELIKSISKQYNNSNIDKKLDIKITQEKQIEFKLKTSEKGNDNVLKFTIPYDDNNLDLLNINNFNNSDFSIENKINILANLDKYNKNSTILKIFHYHNFEKSSELKEEFKKEYGEEFEKEFRGIIEPLLMDEKKTNIFEISTEEKNIIENLPKSIGIYSVEQINEVFKYYNDILFIKRLDLQDIDNNNEYIINSKIDNLILNSNNKKETISEEFSDVLNKTVVENITEKLKKIETESKINILSLSKINTENLNEEKYLDTLFSGKFNEIIEKYYNDGKFKNVTNFMEVKVDKKSEKDEEIIKIRVSEEHAQTSLINAIQEYVKSPASFLANKLSNSIEKEKSILNLAVIDRSLLIEIDNKISDLTELVDRTPDGNNLDNIKSLLLIYKKTREIISKNQDINKLAKKEKDTTGSIINDSALNVALLNNIDMLGILLSDKHMDLKYKKDKEEKFKLIEEKQISEDLLFETPLLYSGLEIMIKINRKIKNKPDVEISGNYNKIRM
ncbi:hypothetical protein GHV25_09260 [Proteus mirabilis]|nr:MULTISPECIES: hypothetical protein [Proteus]MBG2976081.1 hypothetical protein [Proteus mirabilis]MBG3094046.1 hypothetical protein [Proteus mirabilis]MBI6404662.1 hypothetical protein [Proteus sp. PR00208]PLB11176.1 hypothetical protein CYK02_04000 [Proteus mirabilis]HEJ9481214.1 hypothetical protein [Proteus mirabilis]